MADWTRDYFERGYAQRWGLQAPSDQVRQEAAGLWNLLQLSEPCRVIDIGCGHGRHALALAERGAAIVGLDFSVALLDRARQLSAERPARVRWIRGDMRRLPFRSGCAGAAIVIDALGFFDTEEEHRAVLLEASRVVTIGGRLALKVVNGGLVLDDFREAACEEREGVVVSVSNTLTLDPPRLTQRIRVSGTRGQGEYNGASACIESTSCVPRWKTPGCPLWAFSPMRTAHHLIARSHQRCGSSASDGRRTGRPLLASESVRGLISRRKSSAPHRGRPTFSPSATGLPEPLAA